VSPTLSAALRNKTLIIGAAIVLVFVLMALAAYWLAPHDPSAQNLRSRMKPPSAENWMGTDAFGRDVFSRVIWGSQISLMVGLLAVAGGGVIGAAIGLVSGYFGGWVDNLIMRIVDVILTLPSILLAIVIVAISSSGGPLGVAAAVGFANTPRFARVVRSDVLSLRKIDYVSAAVALGASRGRIMLRHILPNVLGSILILASLRIGEAILAEASLSFLGFGPQPPSVTWGFMIAEGRNLLRLSPWIVFFPAGAIMLLVIGFNLLGDGLVSILDPRNDARTRRA
jgi:ABC-type dipeptide/oligopeptide/nickel transport system permease subunit